MGTLSTDGNYCRGRDWNGTLSGRAISPARAPVPNVDPEEDEGGAHQMSPAAQKAYTHIIATTPPTNVTPPYEIIAAFNGMRDKDVQTQK